MPVSASDVKCKRSTVFSDGGANGGRMSTTEIASNVRNNIFPNVTQAERTAGVTRYRKVFWKNENADDLAMSEVKAFVENLTPGDSAVLIFLGTQTNIQSALTGSERLYGCGELDQATGSEAVEIEVAVEDDDHDIFQNGDLIRISDKDDINGTGNEEYVRIYGEPSYVGNVATLPLESALVNSYDALVTRVSSVIEVGDVVAEASDAVVTSSAGTFNDGSHPILASNLGSVQQNWTLTFTSGSAFTVSGDTLGSVGSGTTSAAFEPNNPSIGQPYFTLDHLAFGGTFVSGDTITFSTTPAAVPIWYQLVVPAGAAAEPTDNFTVALDWES